MLIALACTGVGMNKVWQLMSREALWQAWVRLLMRLHAELRYTARPVQEILAQMNPADYQPLAWVSEFCGDRVDIVCPQTLCEEERDFAEGFFAFVGTSDLEGQLAHISQYTERANERLAQVSDCRRRLSKVYLSTAACAGIGVAVMML